MQFAGLTCLSGLTAITMLQTHALDRQIDNLARQHARGGPAPGDARAAISRLQSQRVASLSSIAAAATLLFVGCREIDAFSIWSTPPGMVRDAMILALLLGCCFVMSLPARYYSQRIETGTKAPSETGSFLKIQANILIFWAIFGLPVSWLCLFVMRSADELCWISAGFAICITLLFARPFYGRVVLPRIGAMRPVSGPVNRQVAALLNQVGFKMAGLYERGTETWPGNTGILIQGIGSTKQVLLPSRLLEDLGADEIAAVVAHELGHELAGHGMVRGGFGALAVVLLVGLLWWLTGSSLPMTGLGITADAPAATVFAALLALGNVVKLLAMADHGLARQLDFHADGFVKGLLGPQGLTRALRKLSANDSHAPIPDPLHSLIHHRTAPASERIARIESFAPSLDPVETAEWVPMTERLAWVGRSGLLVFHGAEPGPSVVAAAPAPTGKHMLPARKKRRGSPNPGKQRGPAPASMESSPGNTVRKLAVNRRSRRSAVPA